VNKLQEVKLKIADTVREVFNEKPLDITYLSKYEYISRGSFLVHLQKAKIKAITPWNSRGFLELVPLIEHTPRILYSNQNIIFTEWLEGEILSYREITNEEINQIAILQSNIHKIYFELDRRKFISDLMSRFKTQLNYLEIHNVFPKDSIKILKEFYETLFPDDIKISLIHEDYDVNNLIKTNDGFFCIDNEFVNIYLSGFDLTRPLMDLCVTEERRKLYLQGYKTIENIDFYLGNEDFYRLIFLVERLYSRFRRKLLYGHTDEFLNCYLQLRKIIGKYKKKVYSPPSGRPGIKHTRLNP
jgi:thiamine kinase-like enzyme